MEYPPKFGLHRSLRIRHHAAPRFWIGRASWVEAKVPEGMRVIRLQINAFYVFTLSRWM